MRFQAKGILAALLAVCVIGTTSVSYVASAAEAASEITTEITEETMVTADQYADDADPLAVTERRGDVSGKMARFSVPVAGGCESPFTSKYYVLPEKVTEVSHGVDVSIWNRDIDWQKVKAAGVDFAILRIGYRGYGTGGTLVQDANFAANLADAKAAGIKVGVYFYTQAVNEQEACDEANYVATILNGEKLDLPIFYDLEFPSSGGKNFGRAWDAYEAARKSGDTKFLSKLCNAFCAQTNENGYGAYVYTNTNFLLHHIDRFDLTHPIWLATYATSAPMAEYADYWQYSSTGRVDGINTNVDCNFYFGDINAMGGEDETPKPVEPMVTITPMSYPRNAIASGEFNLTGIVSSTVGLLTNVTGSILNEQKEVVQTVSVTPNAKRLDLRTSEINMGLAFEKLEDGKKYYLQYTAEDETGIKQEWISPRFDVGSTVTITPGACPTGTLPPVPYDLTGTIQSTTNLATVTGTILNSKKETVQRATVKTTAKKMNIATSKLNADLKIDDLKRGTYSIRYTATDAIGTKKTWTSPTFKIDSKITITPTTYPTGKIKAKKIFHIKGTVKSTGRLSNITGTILNEKKKTVQSITMKTNAKSVNLYRSTIDKKLEFDRLKKGTYYLRYTVKDSAGSSKTWTSKSFRVV